MIFTTSALIWLFFFLDNLKNQTFKLKKKHKNNRIPDKLTVGVWFDIFWSAQVRIDRRAASGACFRAAHIQESYRWENLGQLLIKNDITWIGIICIP